MNNYFKPIVFFTMLSSIFLVGCTTICGRTGPNDCYGQVTVGILNVLIEVAKISQHHARKRLLLSLQLSTT